MKRALTVLAIAGSMLSLSSCNKGCDLPDNTNAGVIHETAVIHPHKGYLTFNYGGTLHINESHPYAEDFDVVLNGGSKVPYMSISAQYDILGYAKTTGCDASFAREVNVDLNGNATYSIKVNECKNGCDEQRVTENYVLVPKLNGMVWFVD